MITIARARVTGSTRSVTVDGPRVADMCEPLSATVPTTQGYPRAQSHPESSRVPDQRADGPPATRRIESAQRNRMIRGPGVDADATHLHSANSRVTPGVMDR